MVRNNEYFFDATFASISISSSPSGSSSPPPSALLASASFSSSSAISSLTSALVLPRNLRDLVFELEVWLVIALGAGSWGDWGCAFAEELALDDGGTVSRPLFGSSSKSCITMHTRWCVNVVVVV